MTITAPATARTDAFWALDDIEFDSLTVALADTLPARLTNNQAWPGASVREPDMLDEGRAFWIGAEAVVSVEIERLALPREVLDRAHRIQPTGSGWRRIHPSEYGVEVDSFFEHHGEVASHSAAEAWVLLAETVTA